jgi:hypothetical protein
MSPDLIFGLMIGLPVVILLALRVNATLVFLSLCLGDVLVQFVSHDAGSFMSFLSNSNFSAHPINDNADAFGLILLLLPVVLTTVFMIRTVSGPTKLLLNLLPAAGVGLVGALLAVPLLSPGLGHNIVDSSIWQQVQRAEDLIVSSSALVCLLVLWLQRPKTGHGKHHKHH